MKTLDRHTGVSQSNSDVAIIYIYIYMRGSSLLANVIQGREKERDALR